MSAKRPGTVDYSKWDNIEYSDSESEDDDGGFNYAAPTGRPPSSDDDDEEADSDHSEESAGSEELEGHYSEESESEDDVESDHSIEELEDRAEIASRRHVDATIAAADAQQRLHRPPPAPPPTLAALQRAWGDDADATSSASARPPCANCFSPDARRRCSRCRLVRYCDASCQERYHPIHRLECIDARRHASFWGVFDAKKSGEARDEDEEMAVMLARRNTKRRRALQSAAAAAAVERAKRARMARGIGGKGGGGKGKGADEREEECSICMCEFSVAGDGGVAFCCPTSHYMCNECAGTWVNSVMGDLETSYPPKCPLCKAGISKDLFERQLTSPQQNTFRTYAARTALKPGENIIECKDCGLFEVVSDDPVLWWCPHCECGFCRVCNKDLPFGAVKYDIATSPHALCPKLREPKALIERAIEEGSKMRCPSCKLAGRKDDACTHMACTRCSTEWCYVCGLDVFRCDKAPPLREGRRANDIYLHNRDWETNEKRCPMYLTQILEVDLHWLGENWEENATDEDFEDDERCLDYLHRFRTIKLLQDVKKRIGDKAFLGAFVAFDSIKNCGYTYVEIISTCTDKLIDRTEFLQNREGSRGDDGEEVTAPDTLGRQQIDLLLEAMTAPDRNANGDANQRGVFSDIGNEVDLDDVNERLISQAMHRSEQSAAEEHQIREVVAESEIQVVRQVEGNQNDRS